MKKANKVSKAMKTESPKLIGVYTSSYGRWKFQPAEIKHKCKTLQASLPPLMRLYNIDTVVIQGTSGVALLGLMVVLLPKINWVMVRKPNETSHGFDIEGMRDFNRYLFLDDFIATGETADRVINRLYPAHCVAIVQHSGTDDPEALKLISTTGFSVKPEVNEVIKYEFSR